MERDSSWFEYKLQWFLDVFPNITISYYFIIGVTFYHYSPRHCHLETILIKPALWEICYVRTHMAELAKWSSDATGGSKGQVLCGQGLEVALPVGGSRLASTRFWFSGVSSFLSQVVSDDALVHWLDQYNSSADTCTHAYWLVFGFSLCFSMCQWNVIQHAFTLCLGAPKHTTPGAVWLPPAPVLGCGPHTVGIVLPVAKALVLPPCCPLIVGV